MARILVTGAFSYTGSFVARELLLRGHDVWTMTSHPTPPGPWARPVAAHPYWFHEPSTLRRLLAGTDTVVNTYWMRFPRNGLDYHDAVENIRILAESSTEAGVRRFVHVSVANPDEAAHLPYYRGKAEAERHVRKNTQSHAIARPTWIVDTRDILLNNIAWMLRRLPAFGMPGRGRCPVQPVTGQDAGRILADFAEADGDFTRDVAGPETLDFRDAVRAIRKSIGSRALVVPIPAWAAVAAASLLGPLVGDVVLTRYEVAALRAGLLASREEPLGREAFTPWLARHGSTLGQSYHSELARHFRGVDLAPFRRARS